MAELRHNKFNIVIKEGVVAAPWTLGVNDTVYLGNKVRKVIELN